MSPDESLFFTAIFQSNIYLRTLIEQNQKQRPLTDTEMEDMHFKILKHFGDLHEKLEQVVSQKSKLADE